MFADAGEDGIVGRPGQSGFPGRKGERGEVGNSIPGEQGIRSQLFNLIETTL